MSDQCKAAFEEHKQGIAMAIVEFGEKKRLPALLERLDYRVFESGWNAALAAPAGEASTVPSDWVATIDRIVPSLDPEPDENLYCCEWALWSDRRRIRAELAKLQPAPATEPGAESSMHGYVLMPSDHLPPAMEQAAVNAAREYTARTGGNCMKTIYRALVAAAKALEKRA